jgi:hypothetical protein
MDTNLADIERLGLLLHTKAPMSQLQNHAHYVEYEACEWLILFL